MAETNVLVQAGHLALRFRDCAVEESSEGDLTPVMRFSLEGARKLRGAIDDAILVLEKTRQ